MSGEENKPQLRTSAIPVQKQGKSRYFTDIFTNMSQMLYGNNVTNNAVCRAHERKRYTDGFFGQPQGG